MLDAVRRSTCVRPNGCVKLRRPLERVAMATVVGVVVVAAVGVAVAVATWVVVVGRVLSCKKRWVLLDLGFVFLSFCPGWGFIWVELAFWGLGGTDLTYSIHLFLSLCYAPEPGRVFLIVLLVFA